MGKVILFDFDGTVVDSFATGIAIFNELTGHKHASRAEEIEVLRGLPTGKVLKTLGIRFWHLPFLLKGMRTKMTEHVDSLEIFIDLTEVIHVLHARGYRMFILSTNSAENIMQFTSRHDIAQYFEGIYGDIGLFSKAKVIRKVMRDNRIEKADCVYIGDETRDVHAAQRVGIPCIAVTWGFLNRAALEAAKPTHLADKPKDLLRFLP